MFRYRERVLPSAANLALPVLLFVTVFAIMLPLNAAWAAPLAALTSLVLVAVLVFTSPTIAITAETLDCGKAEIPIKFLGEVTVIPKEQVFVELGRNLDARAWLSIQASVKGLVKVEIKDAKDRTPYWLISTRNPEALLAALKRN